MKIIKAKNIIFAGISLILSLSLLNFPKAISKNEIQPKIQMLNVTPKLSNEPAILNDSVSWYLSSNNEVLYITGSGRMKDFNSDEERPWNDYASIIRSVNIASGITAIGDHAFDDFVNLTHTVLPNNLLSIGKDAYKNCHKLNSIIFPATLTTIKDSAFEGCTDLSKKSITIPSSVTYLGKDVFKDCSNIQSMEIYANVESIPENFCLNCTSLRSVAFKSLTINNIEANAFKNCSSLLSIIFIHTDISTFALADTAFENCKSSGAIYIPAGLNEDYNTYILEESANLNDWVIIEKNKFKNNPTVWWALSQSSTHLHIGGDGAMDDFGELNSSDAPWKNNRSSITNVTIDNHITRIGDYAFDMCSKITNVVIGDRVQEIGVSAFWACAKIKSITFPETLKSIGEEAFYGCSTLSTIQFLGTNLETVGSGAIESNRNNHNKTIYIDPGYTESFTEVVSSLGLTVGAHPWAIVETKVTNPISNYESGVYNDKIEIVLSNDDPNAEIYYTIDGEIPTLSSTKYTEPIVLEATNNTSAELTIKAIAAKEQWENSEVVEFNYKVKNKVALPTVQSEPLKYNGDEQTFIIEENDLYTIVGNKQTDVGNYIATVSLKDTENHIWETDISDDLEINFSIEKGILDFSNVSFQNKDVEYNGDFQSIEIVGELPKDVTVSYTNNTGKNVGYYTAVANFIYDENKYEMPSFGNSVTALLTIKKFHVDMPQEIIEPFYYTGEELVYAIPESPYYTIYGNKQTKVGDYQVVVTLNDPFNTYWSNGANEESFTFDFIIQKGTYDLSNVSFTDKTITYDGHEHSIEIEGTLPEGLSVSYIGKGLLSRETPYIIIAHFDGDYENYNEIIDMTARLTIQKIVAPVPIIDDTPYIYNGSVKTYNIPENSAYTIKNNKQTDAGTYQVSVSLKDKSNSCWNDGTIEDLQYTFIIQKATYDLSNIKFESKVVIYDGKDHTVEVEGTLPEGLSVEYIGPYQFNAIGVYYITIAFISNDENNYEHVPQMQVELSITEQTVTRPSLDTTVFTYNGLEQTYNIPESPYYTIYGNTQTDAGIHEVIITLIDPDKNLWDDGTSGILVYQFEILKNVYDMSNVSISPKQIVYDGESHGIEIEGTLPEGVRVSYTGRGTNVGQYVVTAKFQGDSTNYELIPNLFATLTIAKMIIDIPNVDTNRHVYTGKELTYAIPENDNYIIYGNKKTDAGTYTTIVSLLDPINHEWSDHTTSNKEFTFVIEKADYTLVDIKFVDQEFDYDGLVHSLELEGELPLGISVEYINNENINPGTYGVIAKFNVDCNHNPIPDMTAILRIKEAASSLTSSLANIEVDGGFISTITLNSKEVLISSGNYSMYLDKGESLIAVYDINVKNADGTNYILDSNKTYTIKISLPKGVKENTNFIISHVHNREEVSYIKKGTAPAIGTYVIEDGYIVTKINKLSEFLFIERTIIPDNVCFIHYIQLMLFIFFISLFVIWFVVLGHHKFDPISISGLSVFFVVTITTAIIGNCEKCVSVHILSILSLIIAVGLYLLFGYLNPKYNLFSIFKNGTLALNASSQEETKEENVQQDNENVEVDNVSPIETESKEELPTSTNEEEVNTPTIPETNEEEKKEEKKNEEPKKKPQRKQNHKKKEKKINKDDYLTK